MDKSKVTELEQAHPEYENVMDNLATELLQELRADNRRKHRLNCGLIIANILIVAGFLLFLYQFGFSTTTTHTAEGVYAIVDSEGNVISSNAELDEIIKNAIIERQD